MKILAAVAKEKSKPLVLEELQLDEPRHDEILVKVVASGICQTDAHVVNQHLPTPLPVVLGHEGAGIVERVGSSVTTLKPGDHVVMSYQACGHCTSCLSGHYPYCDSAMQLNFSGTRLDGTRGIHYSNNSPQVINGHFFGQSSFATYALTTERNTVKVPDDAPLEILGALGCGFQTGAGAILKSLKVKSGSSIAIFGAGAVGLAALMAARIAGAAIIIAVDINEKRLETATELGATHTLNPKTDDLTKVIKEITGRGINYVFDTSGRQEVIQQAIASLAPMGQVGLVAFGGNRSTIITDALAMGISVRGIVQGDAIPQLFIPELIHYYQAGQFPFDKLVKTFKFSEINEAFAASASGEVIKPIVLISE